MVLLTFFPSCFFLFKFFGSWQILKERSRFISILNHFVSHQAYFSLLTSYLILCTDLNKNMSDLCKFIRKVPNKNTLQIYHNSQTPTLAKDKLISLTKVYLVLSLYQYNNALTPLCLGYAIIQCITVSYI